LNKKTERETNFQLNYYWALLQPKTGGDPDGGATSAYKSHPFAEKRRNLTQQRYP